MSTAWTTIVFAGIGTFAMRASFLAVAHRLVHVPPRAHRVLRQIPPAALAALVLPAILRPDGNFDLLQARVPAALLAALVAWRTRNVALTLVVGMGVLLAFELL
jgi:branched-subunit amino acid transport protein